MYMVTVRLRAAEVELLFSSIAIIYGKSKRMYAFYYSYHFI